jgi:type IV secretory pathway VirB10-like protein
MDDQDKFDLEAGVPNIPDQPPAIEGEIRPKPKFADRISKKVIGIAIGTLGLVISIFFVAIDSMDHKKPANTDDDNAAKMEGKSVSDGVPKDLLGIEESDGKDGKPHRASLVKPETAKAASAVDVAGSQGSMFPNDNGVTVPSIHDGTSNIPKEAAGDKNHTQTAKERADEAAWQAAIQAQQMRRERLAQARTDGLNVTSFNSEDKASASDAVLRTANNSSASANNLVRTSGQASSAQPQTEQDEKLNFIKDAAKEDRSYHPYKAAKALSENEVKTGSYIPMTLAQGINSDLPGQITARVSEDVYDTITGCRLLIPAMSTVVGKYDSKVAMGQARMLVVWNTVVFPDGEELNLAGMQGYDTGGYAGLNSDVDNHFFRVFGLALGMSLVTATVQMSLPQTNNTGTVQSPSQMVQTALAQQYGQLGAQILGKYMQVQPTLKNYPGERFMIVVPRTIMFDKVWRNRCVAESKAEE